MVVSVGSTLHKSFVVFNRGYLRRLCMILAFKKQAFLVLLLGAFAPMVSGSSNDSASAQEIERLIAAAVVPVKAAEQRALEAKTLDEKIEAEGALAKELYRCLRIIEEKPLERLSAEERAADRVIVDMLLTPTKARAQLRIEKIYKDMGARAQKTEKVPVSAGQVRAAGPTEEDSTDIQEIAQALAAELSVALTKSFNVTYFRK